MNKVLTSTLAMSVLAGTPVMTGFVSPAPVVAYASENAESVRIKRDEAGERANAYHSSLTAKVEEVNTLSAAITQLSAEMETLNTESMNLGNAVAEARGRVSTAEQELNNAQARIDEITNAQQNLNRKNAEKVELEANKDEAEENYRNAVDNGEEEDVIAGYGAIVNEVIAQLNAKQDEIDDLNDFINSVDMNDLTAQYNAATDNKTRAQQELDTEMGRLADVETRKANLQAQIETVNGQFESGKAEVSALEQRYNEAIATFNNLDARYKELAKAEGKKPVENTTVKTDKPTVKDPTIIKPVDVAVNNGNGGNGTTANGGETAKKQDPNKAPGMDTGVEVFNPVLLGVGTTGFAGSVLTFLGIKRKKK